MRDDRIEQDSPEVIVNGMPELRASAPESGEKLPPIESGPFTVEWQDGGEPMETERLKQELADARAEIDRLRGGHLRRK